MWISPPTDGFMFETEGEADFTGSLLLVAFPTPGRVSLLATNYLTDYLDIARVGGVYSSRLPSAAVVRDHQPAGPVRLYLGEQTCGPVAECRAFGAVVSELTVEKDAAYPLAMAILEWARTVGVRHVATIEGVRRGDGATGERMVGGVATTAHGRELLEDAGATLRSDGVVEGLSGVLLAEGARRGMSVFCLIPEVEQDRDPLAAARVLDVVDEFLVHVDVDIEPLRREAERLREAQEPIAPAEPLMYT